MKRRVWFRLMERSSCGYRSSLRDAEYLTKSGLCLRLQPARSADRCRSALSLFKARAAESDACHGRDELPFGFCRRQCPVVAFDPTRRLCDTLCETLTSTCACSVRKWTGRASLHTGPESVGTLFFQHHRPDYRDLRCPCCCHVAT